MRSNAETVDAYVKELQSERKNSLLQLRSLIRKHAPTIKETMEYGMATFRYGAGKYDFIAVASQKHYMSLYLDPNILDRYRSRFEDFNIGKSCIRFTSFSQLDMAIVEKMLSESLQK